jgi:hypothetical protein
MAIDQELNSLVTQIGTQVIILFLIDRAYRLAAIVAGRPPPPVDPYGARPLVVRGTQLAEDTTIGLAEADTEGGR